MLATICVGVEDQIGLEAYRPTSREEDPVLENAELQVTLEVNKLGNVRCKDTAETKRLLSMLELRRREFKGKTGKEMPEKTLTQVL